jgi:hypothetical protein
MSKRVELVPRRHGMSMAVAMRRQLVQAAVTGHALVELDRDGNVVEESVAPPSRGMSECGTCGRLLFEHRAEPVTLDVCCPC